MNYSSEEEYNYHISGGAEAEAQAQIDCQYQKYLEDIALSDPYLYSLEIAQDLYASPAFKKSGLDFNEFINQLKTDRRNAKPQTSGDESALEELPF